MNANPPSIARAQPESATHIADQVLQVLRTIAHQCGDVRPYAWRHAPGARQPFADAPITHAECASKIGLPAVAEQRLSATLKTLSRVAGNVSNNRGRMHRRIKPDAAIATVWLLVPCRRSDVLGATNAGVDAIDDALRTQRDGEKHVAAILSHDAYAALRVLDLHGLCPLGARAALGLVHRGTVGRVDGIFSGFAGQVDVNDAAVEHGGRAIYNAPEDVRVGAVVDDPFVIDRIDEGEITGGDGQLGHCRLLSLSGWPGWPALEIDSAPKRRRMQAISYDDLAYAPRTECDA